MSHHRIEGHLFMLALVCVGSTIGGADAMPQNVKRHELDLPAAFSKIAAISGRRKLRPLTALPTPVRTPAIFVMLLSSMQRPDRFVYHRKKAGDTLGRSGRSTLRIGTQP
jgi:hypothetical protein